MNPGDRVTLSDHGRWIIASLRGSSDVDSVRSSTVGTVLFVDGRMVKVKVPDKPASWWHRDFWEPRRR